MPEALIVIIPLYISLGALFLYARREDVIREGGGWEKATARMILLIPIWPLWVAYHIISGLVIGLWWVSENAFKKED